MYALILTSFVFYHEAQSTVTPMLPTHAYIYLFDVYVGPRVHEGLD